ncbi:MULTISPECIES: polymorphic toxin-type HINT domain-containing protein [Cysteiniphilum]|uniref:polymorphic toxin-type HINT domain-containing protein n=1 Tax=Cysteiniphilum TaxID=2056696 RepID=UPI00177CEF16|nr:MULTISPECIES: polymorphic toxin-type HINT domain-containing protein [Cysteiniphilum]
MYYYPKLFCSLLLFGLLVSRLSLAASAQVTNYDLMSITPKTWQQVTLNYTDLIDGQSYPAEIKLLRPIKWLKENGIDQVGKRFIFSLPEFGVDQVEVTVTDIADTKVDTKADDWRKEKTKTVIGTFKRYAQDVRTYTFIDDKGNIEQINATPNHPFYVVNQQAYVAIDDITINDNLISQSGKILQLICSGEQISSCGRSYYQGDKPIIVYNFEVHLDHVYYVGENGFLVHNPYGRPRSNSLDDTLLQNYQNVMATKEDLNQAIKKFGMGKTFNTKTRSYELGSRKALGPVLARAVDKKTGHVSQWYYNDPFGAPSNKTSSQILGRLDLIEDGGQVYSLVELNNNYGFSLGSGSHAEVSAVNELFIRRPSAQFSDMLVATYDITQAGRVGMIKPPCPHCAAILTGASYVR